MHLRMSENESFVVAEQITYWRFEVYYANIVVPPVITSISWLTVAEASAGLEGFGVLKLADEQFLVVVGRNVHVREVDGLEGREANVEGIRVFSEGGVIVKQSCFG